YSVDRPGGTVADLKIPDLQRGGVHLLQHVPHPIESITRGPSPWLGRAISVRRTSRSSRQGRELARLVSCGPEKQRLPDPSAKLVLSLYVWVASVCGGLSPGHSRVTHSRNRTVIAGHQKDTKAAPFEFNSRLWEPEGHLWTSHRYGSGP